MNKLSQFQEEEKTGNGIEAEPSLGGYTLEGEKMRKLGSGANGNAAGAKTFEYKMKKMEKWPSEAEPKRNQWGFFANFNSVSPVLSKDKAAARLETKETDFVTPQ